MPNYSGATSPSYINVDWELVVKAIALAITIMALFPATASAKRGWACAEEGRVQKYKRAGITLVTEGDPFSNLIQSDNRALGKPEHDLLPRWHILVNNADGLVAVMSETGKSTENGTRTTERNGIGYAYAYMLLINKITGRFRHFVSNLSPRNDSSTSKEGSCVEY